MSKDIINSPTYFYYPKCKEKGCEGLLEIQLNEYNFTISYQCEMNPNHKGENIFFDTFGRFFLRKKSYERCYKCNLNLENTNIYKCKKCNKNYCSFCFLFDEHIKDINNLEVSSKRCHIHQSELNDYCTDCGQKICIFCLKSNIENNIHKSHHITYTLKNMPSINDINCLNDKIDKKIKYIESLIISIEEYKKILIQKIDRLKNNLKSEINLLKKLYLNLNPFFSNYVYYKNIIDFRLENTIFNNKYLNNFYNSFSLEEKLNNIKEVLFYNRGKIISKNAAIYPVCLVEDYQNIQISDKYFLCYSEKQKTIDINYYNEEEKKINYIKNTQINFKDKIYSISYSNKNNKIYVCLSDQIKKVKILYFNLNENELKICEEEIQDNFSFTLFMKNFNKCIYLKEDYVATSDNKYIIIWKKDNNNKYLNINRIELNTDINDLLLINNDYFISSQSSKETIIFFNINNFQKEKTLYKIDSIKSFNSLFLIKKNIIIYCKNSIKIISVNTKELIQIIEMKNNLDENKICITNKDIYYLEYADNNLSVIKMELIDNTFTITEEYKNIQEEKNDEYISSEKDLVLDELKILYNNNNVILFGNDYYILKENNNNDNK